MRRTLAALLAALAAPAGAQEWPRDPYVPQHVKRSEGYVETRGAALQAQVERKLRAQFEAADTTRSGYITRAQAREAGLGYIARDFDAIDRSRGGLVSFEDVLRHLKSRPLQSP